MKLYPGQEAEYRKRHTEIWPELKELLKQNGVGEYSIFLDQETLSLFAVMLVADSEKLNMLPHEEIMKRWWHHMADIMETNEDESPVSTSLEEVFYLP